MDQPLCFKGTVYSRLMVYENFFDMIESVWKAQDAGEIVVVRDNAWTRMLGYQGTLHSWQIKLTSVMSQITGQCKNQAHWKIRERVRTAKGRESLLDRAVRNELLRMMA